MTFNTIRLTDLDIPLILNHPSHPSHPSSQKHFERKIHRTPNQL